MIGGKLALVWDPLDSSILQGWVGIALDDSGKPKRLEFKLELGFVRAHPMACLDPVYGFLGPLAMHNSFRESPHWEPVNGIPLGTVNLPVQLIGGLSIGKAETLCGCSVQSEVIHVVIRDEEAFNWASTMGAAVLSPPAYDKSGKMSEPSHFSAGTGVPDVTRLVASFDKERASSVDGQVTNLHASVMQDRIANPGRWRWVETMVTLAITMFETRAEMAKRGVFKLFAVPITNTNASSVTLLCLVLAILDDGYHLKGTVPLKTSLDAACLLVYPRLFQFGSCQLQSCFDTHAILNILEIHIRSLQCRIRSASYSILAGKPRKPGAIPKPTSLSVSWCPCTLADEHKELAEFFRRRPEVPESDLIPAHFPPGHEFDFAAPETLKSFGHTKRTARPSQKATLALTSSSSPRLVRTPVYTGVEFAPIQDDGVPAWDPSSLLVTPPRPPQVDYAPVSPLQNVSRPVTPNYSPVSPIPWSRPVTPGPCTDEMAPDLNSSVVFDYTVPDELIAALEHIKHLDDAKAKAVRKLNALVAEAASKGVRLSYSFIE